MQWAGAQPRGGQGGNWPPLKFTLFLPIFDSSVIKLEILFLLCHPNTGGSPVNEVAWVQKKVSGDKTKRQQHESQWTHQGNAWQDDSSFPKPGRKGIFQKIMIQNRLPKIMRVSKEGKKVETMTRPSVLPDLNQTKDICYTCILHTGMFLP